MANTLLLLTSCLIGGAAAARGGAFRDGAAAAVAAVVPARRSLLQTSLTYPPVGLTSNNFTLTGAAYGNGAYFATAASTPSSAWYGFDKTGAHWENCGVETCNQYCYQGANYACGVQYTPLVNEGNYGGEWLQITLPDAIQLTSYTLSSAGDYTSTPFSWSIAGSNDGVVWHGLDRRDNLNGGGNAVRTYSASASDSYKSFRITVSRVYMQPWDYNFIRIRRVHATAQGRHCVCVLHAAVTGRPRRDFRYVSHIRACATRHERWSAVRAGSSLSLASRSSYPARRRRRRAGCS
jgi:hypothetical protein